MCPPSDVRPLGGARLRPRTARTLARLLGGVMLPWTLAGGMAQAAVVIDSPATLAELSLEELATLEITSVSRTPSSLSDAPAAIFVITGEDIRRAGATSLPEALRLAPNLQVAQKNAHDWAISARGFNTELSNKLLVMIDGRTVYTPLFSGVFWDRQDYLLEDIERIEVVSGPGGTLWGANAVNGVINIVTKSARDTHGSYLEAGGGTQLDGFGGVRYGRELAPGVHLRAYGKYFERDDQELANGTPANDAWRMGQGGFRIDAALSAQDDVTIQGDYLDGDERLVADGSAEVSGYNLLARWSHVFANGSDMRLQTYYDRTYLLNPIPEQSLPPLVLAPAGILKDELDTIDVDFQHHFALGARHDIVWGLGYRYTHNVVSNAPALAFEPAVLDRDLFSAFVQDQIELLEQLSLVIGSKFEHNEYTGSEVQPSVRLAWSPSTQHTFWGAVSRAVRTPSRFDQHLRLPTPLLVPFIENLLVGSRDFVAEKVIAYELGYRVHVGTRLSAALSGFYNDYANLRSTSLSPGVGFPLFFANNLKGETYGFEFNAKLQLLDWWRVRAGYTLLEQRIRVRPGRFDFNNALNETADPEQQFSLGSSLGLGRDLELDANLRWVDRLPTNRSGVVAMAPDYAELDLRLGWRPHRNLELALVGQNLLHRDHVEYFVSGAVPPVEIQRAVLGKVALRF